jgi:hypothetical protein
LEREPGAWPQETTLSANSVGARTDPYEFPPFRAADYMRPAAKPDTTQEDCDQVHAQAARPLPVVNPKTPLEIIRQLYEDLLSSNWLDGVNSERNRARYFALALLPVFAADAQDACASAIELSGQLSLADLESIAGHLHRSSQCAAAPFQQQTSLNETVELRSLTRRQGTPAPRQRE